MDKTFENLIIFEMANNHQGDVEHGLKIISKLSEIVRKYKINAAIKFQYRDLDTMIHPDFKNRTDVKHIPRFISTRLSSDHFYTMVKAVKDAGILSMCTPFDEKSVDLCMDHGIDIIKVASCSATDWPLLEAIAVTKKPVIVSTGGKTFTEMDNIYNFMTHRNVDFALLHCVGMYPVLPEDVQLNCIDKMKNRYPSIAIGYSGHEDPTDMIIPCMAVGKGAKIFERHVGLETDGIKLNAYSTDVNDVEKWVVAILNALKICGNQTRKNISVDELKSMNELARGCYASRAIMKGEDITRDMVFFAMPCSDGQTTSGHFEEGMIATEDYAINEGIYEKRDITLAKDIRSLIHDIKSMLYEAKVILSNEFELELSHHYGLEHFRRYGAAIVNIINREYCKKIIVILPGQRHPIHHHKAKEESFHVLSGTMELSLGDVTKTVAAGEVITVERGVPHAFSSINGCIFEEVSSTHIKNDSYYEDESISKKDLLERKTIMKEW